MKKVYKSIDNITKDNNENVLIDDRFNYIIHYLKTYLEFETNNSEDDQIKPDKNKFYTYLLNSFLFMTSSEAKYVSDIIYKCFLEDDKLDIDEVLILNNNMIRTKIRRNI